jgi:hypothetical protein
MMTPPITTIFLLTLRLTSGDKKLELHTPQKAQAVIMTKSLGVKKPSGCAERGRYSMSTITMSPGINPAQ